MPPIDPLDDEEEEAPLTIGDDEPLDEEGEVPLTIGVEAPLDEEDEVPLTIGDDEPLDEEEELLPTLLLLLPKESPLPPLGCPLEGA